MSRSCAAASSVPLTCVMRCATISCVACSAFHIGAMTIGRPAASVAMALQNPNTPHNGGASSIVASGPIENPLTTSNACLITVRWSCSTNFGALVVPEVVKMAQPASGVALFSSRRAPPPSNLYERAALPSTTAGGFAPASSYMTTDWRCSSAFGSQSPRIPAKSIPLNPGQNINTRERERCRISASSWLRKRVLTDTAMAPSCAQAKNAASHAGTFGSHSATQSPGCTPSPRSPCATRRLSSASSRNATGRPRSISAGVTEFTCCARSAGKVSGIAFKIFPRSEKNSQWPKKIRCGDCIRQSMPI